MYLLCFNALRDAYRVLTGRFYRLCRIYPFSRHGRGVTEALNTVNKDGAEAAGKAYTRA